MRPYRRNIPLVAALGATLLIAGWLTVAISALMRPKA